MNLTQKPGYHSVLLEKTRVAPLHRKRANVAFGVPLRLDALKNWAGTYGSLALAVTRPGPGQTPTQLRPTAAKCSWMRFADRSTRVNGSATSSASGATKPAAAA